ncbi:MAG: hypothetical protein A2W19_07230 [Spirochaetes bacterium RBG_16_49_21]|nr:MAG: hypothetical protein A2W19_07230 [Spirochaetes bacterium RBG_16_49_21]
MKFLNKIDDDHLVVGISLLVIMTCSVLLYAEFTRKVEAGGAKMIGTVSYKREVAQRKYASQVIWEDVDQNAPVYDNDSVRTADLSEAVIKLKDGTSINLDENSLILLSLTGEGININFSHGSMSASREDVQEGGTARVEIQSRDAVVSVEKGEVKLSRTGDKKMDVTVTEGKAEITTAAGEKTIEKDEKAVITADEAPKVLKLKLKLKAPLPNEIFIAAGGVVSTDFSWEHAADDAEVYLEIAGDSRFTRGIVVRPSTKDSISENLGAGSYFWRIKAVNASTKRVEYSDAWKFNILQDEPVLLIAPRNGETVSYSSKPPIVSFRWQKNRLASEYAVEIANDAAFTAILFSAPTRLEDLSIDTLEAGSYYWRVRTKNAIAASYTGSSPIWRLAVEKRIQVNPPVLLSPPDASTVSRAMFTAGKDFIFSWSFDSQVKQYELAISRDKDFKDVAFRIRSSGNFHVVHEPLQPGTYFWRVAAATGSGIEAVSSANALVVVPVEDIRLNDPMVLSRSGPGTGDGYAKILFSWSKSSYPADYRFELAKDKGFLEIKDLSTIADNSRAVDGVRAGVYFWRVKLLDRSGNQLLESRSRPLYVSAKGAIVARLEDIQPPESPSMGKEEVKAAKEGKAAVKQEAEAKKTEETAKEKESEKKGEARADKKEDAPTSAVITKPEHEEKFRGRRVAWKVNLASTVMSQPVSYNNILITTTRSGFLVGLSRHGARLWRVNLGGAARSTPAAARGVAYVATVKGLLYAVSTADGAVKWTKPVEGPLLYGSAPIVENDRVYVATGYGVVQAFSSEGKEIWRRDLEEGIFSPMTYAKGLLYVGTDRSKIYALDADDGDIEWEYQTDGRIFYSSPKVYKGLLFAGCYSGTFYALQAGSGKLKWKFAAKRAILSTPAFFNDAVYFGSEEGMVYALSIDDGKKLWEFKTGATIVAGPDVSRNNVLIPSGNTIYSIDGGSGRLNWKEGFAASINTPVTIVGGMAFVGLDNGEVVSLRSY